MPEIAQLLLENLVKIDMGIWSFLFFLLIFCVGYMFVEMVMGRRYFFREELENYGNSFFDRILHYFIMGILINVWFVMYLHVINFFGPLADFFNKAWVLAEMLKQMVGNSLVAQLAIFGSYYFFLVFLFFIQFRFILFFDTVVDFSINLGKRTGEFAWNAWKYLKKSKKRLKRA